MAQDSEKRFHSIMEKLFNAPKSSSLSSPSSSSGVQFSGGKKRPYQSTALGVTELNLRGDGVEGHQSFSAAAGTPQGALCRPWDRGDFMRRLATFKSISWFAKPKIVSAVNCARRGWINVDIDTIACEACGARAFFSTKASWDQQQVDKAALVFSLKLDNGHKLLCPWTDNACDESLARFPPTAPPVLVENFRERCSALLQLSALPRISSSAIERLQSPLLEDFLGQSLIPESGNGPNINTGIEILSNQEELKLYYQAQKLISLCGWKLHSLPYIVDCKDISTQSVKNTTTLDCSQVVSVTKNNSQIVHSGDTDESLEASENSKGFIFEQIDPNSAVLNCTLCGATVGLWAFCTVPRPVESIRLEGYSDMNGNDLENRLDVNNTMSPTLSKDISSSLNMTIAGGPPPTKQNFKAIISLPVVGQNLRARLSFDSDFRDEALVDGGGIQSESEKRMRIEGKTDNSVNASIGQPVTLSSETDSQASTHGSVGEVIEGTHYAGQSSILKDKMPVHTEADRLNSSAAGDPCCSQISVQKNLTEGEALSVSQKTLDGEVSILGSYGVKERVENPINNKDQHQLRSLGRDVRPRLSNDQMEFDPIRQHRHFCPWIASIDDGEPGWKQTLSALYYQKNQLPHSPNRSPSSVPTIKVDDPVGSVRKLFMSPSSTKRMKLNR